MDKKEKKISQSSYLSQEVIRSYLSQEVIRACAQKYDGEGRE